VSSSHDDSSRNGRSGRPSEAPESARILARQSRDALEARIDRALAEWPLPERSALDWDEAAARVTERVASTGRSRDEWKTARGAVARDITDDVLFGPPEGLDDEPESAVVEGRYESPRWGSQQQAGKPAGHFDAAEGTMGMQFERERDRRSFQDLAKLASSPSLTPPPPSAASAASLVGAAKADDSGLIDLKAMAEASLGQLPTITTVPSTDDVAGGVPAPLASSPLFDEPAPASAAPVSSVASVAPAVASTPSPTNAAPAAVGAAPGKSKTGLVVSGIAAVLAVAAGALFLARPSATPEASTPVRAETPVQAAPAAEPAAPAVQAQAQAAAVAEPGATPEATAEATPPSEEPAVAHAETAGASSHHAAGATVKAASAKDPKAAAVAVAAPAKGQAAATKGDEPAVDARLVVKDAPAAVAPAAATGSSLGDAMRQAAGPIGGASESGGNAGPAFAAGTVPQKPSQGAVTGALNAVLPAARGCLGPDDPISRASIEFQSNGTVKAVNVTGFAAGKPAEACIKAALSKAKLAPFAEPSYTAPTITVRPNS
jgi:hypothetical protein